MNYKIGDTRVPSKQK